ncbi:P-loop NTPase fold protein [Pedobacter sp. PF22-3]|uniref:KAP family P-loop NTPase fold protein n=1 Tax=Pedobacter sp. PF22-3 TaxID=2994467 RepID=UPI0022476833|nr:P-loop NTPase fold protein [Pedobacter sp. PF22-3]MCX2494725.1 P-loop NTPase fold protein [Pedobacter sp. PF22-3]
MLKLKFNAFPSLAVAIFLLILLFFRLPVSNLLDAILVTPIFSHFESNFYQDLLLIGVLAIAGFWTAKRVSSEFLLQAFLFIVVFYLLEKYNSFWKFKSLVILQELGYFDLLFGFVILTVLMNSLFFKESSKLEGESLSTGFIEDNAVVTAEQDHFHRKEAAAAIAKLVLETKNTKSFAIGILGAYGSGKTSFLNLINLELKRKDVIQVVFDPWRASDPQMIRKELFDLLASRIAEVDLKISSLIYSYGRRLAGFDTRSLSLLNWLGFFRKQGGVQSSGEYQQINKMLGATGRKVVVTIDDLDRLYPAEIIEVLRLIRNTASFSNVVYLVGYDKGYVQGAIDSLNNSAGDYLDKIFQLEILLPKREADNLLSSLSNELKVILSEEHYAVFEKEMIPFGFKDIYGRAYGQVLRQGRDVVRFLNTFKIAYQLIGKEVDFQCLLLLELIKFRFTDIYDLIYTHHDRFLYEQPLMASHQQHFSPRMAKEKSFKDRTEGITVFREYLQGMGKFSADDIELVDALFQALFNGNRYNRPEAKNSIAYPLYFEIYFRYRLSQTDLSDNEYQAAKSPGDMVAFMQYCASHNLHKQLMTRLLQEESFKNRMEFEQVIRWIFVFGRTFVEKEGMFRFNYESLISKIFNYNNSIIDKFYKEHPTRYKEFINSLFSAAIAPYLFENELIFHLKEKGGFVLSADELATHQLSYFRNYAESSHGLNDDVLWIFYGAREYFNYDSLVGRTKGWRFEPALVEKMKEYITSKDSKEFLKFSIHRDIREKGMVSIYTQVLDMFENPLELAAIVAGNPFLDAKIKQEYLELLGKLSAVDYKEYVEMEFQSELKKEDGDKE